MECGLASMSLVELSESQSHAMGAQYDGTDIILLSREGFAKKYRDDLVEMFSTRARAMNKTGPDSPSQNFCTGSLPLVPRQCGAGRSSPT